MDWRSKAACLDKPELFPVNTPCITDRRSQQIAVPAQFKSLSAMGIESRQDSGVWGMSETNAAPLSV